MFPGANQKSDQTELPGPIDSIGSRAVNNLSNKIILTLFQPHAPFFRLTATDDVLEELKVATDGGNPDAAAILKGLDKALVKGEKDAMRELDYTHYRTEATTAAKALIITGNTLMYHPEGEGKAQVYNLRNYVVVRDLSGTIIELITKDTKELSTFSDDIRRQVAESDKKKYKEDASVDLYTHLKLTNGKFILKQSINEIDLDSEGSYTPADMPWIVLTWNRIRGSNYGTGLVEDYAGAFHGIYVLTQSLVEVVGASADLKWLVDPTSMLDVKELNDSTSGTYHSGREGDVTALQVNKQLDLQSVTGMLQDWKQQIGQAFLMFNSVQRQAERVTAEEIREVINDLEVSHGGIYSRFSEEWQFRTATLMLNRVDITLGDGKQLYPKIITGLDSLSRAGDMQNFRLFIEDLAAIGQVPDVFQGEFHPSRLMAWVGIRRGIDVDEINLTDIEKQEIQQAQQAQQQQQIEAESGAQLAVKAGEQQLQQ